MYSLPPIHQLQALTTSVAFGFVLLMGTGCNGAHSAGTMRGMAPALNGDKRARNVADPNAPFFVKATGPHLSQRQPLLDVNGVGNCAPAQLTMWESEARSNGDRHSLRFSIANNGEACRMGGFPSLSLLRADGSVLGNVQLRRVSDTAMAATLAPAGAKPASASDDSLSTPSPAVLLPTNGRASFQLGWTTGPTCESVSPLAIGMPGASHAVVIPRPLQVCEDQVLITAVSSAGS